jgi:hypothetical protein
MKVGAAVFPAGALRVFGLVVMGSSYAMRAASGAFQRGFA